MIFSVVKLGIRFFFFKKGCYLEVSTLSDKGMKGIKGSCPPDGRSKSWNLKQTRRAFCLEKGTRRWEVT